MDRVETNDYEEDFECASPEDPSGHALLSPEQHVLPKIEQHAHQPKPES